MADQGIAAVVRKCRLQPMRESLEGFKGKTAPGLFRLFVNWLDVNGFLCAAP
ncbi:MAG: hypothetical protein ACK44A_01660 [Roseateles sp.]